MFLDYPGQRLHQLDVKRNIRVAFVDHIDFQHVIDPLYRVERIFDMSSLRAKLEGGHRNRQRL